MHARPPSAKYEIWRKGSKSPRKTHVFGVLVRQLAEGGRPTPDNRDMPIIPPVDRWPTGWPTDQRSKTPLKIGICIDSCHPLARWPDYEGVITFGKETGYAGLRFSSRTRGCWMGKESLVVP